MGINDPIETARATFVTSRACTDVIVTAIKKGKGDFSVYDHLQPMTQLKKEMSHEIKGFQEDKLTLILISLGEERNEQLKEQYRTRHPPG